MLNSAFAKVATRTLSLFSATAFVVLASSIVPGPSFVGDAEAGKRAKSHQVRRTSVRSHKNTRQFVQRQRNINRYNNRVVIGNHLQSQRRAGAVLANPGYAKVGGVVIVNNSNHRRSGVVIRKNGQNHLLVQRQRYLNHRNDRVLLENHLQSIRRSNAVLANPHLHKQGEVLVYDDQLGVAIGSSNEIRRTRHGTLISCPKSHNCGYRLYSNGTGPRIITPGVPAGNGLPEYDGIAGPSIITLGE